MLKNFAEKPQISDLHVLGFRSFEILPSNHAFLYFWLIYALLSQNFTNIVNIHCIMGSRKNGNMIPSSLRKPQPDTNKPNAGNAEHFHTLWNWPWTSRFKDAIVKSNNDFYILNTCCSLEQQHKVFPWWVRLSFCQITCQVSADKSQHKMLQFPLQNCRTPHFSNFRTPCHFTKHHIKTRFSCLWHNSGSESESL